MDDEHKRTFVECIYDYDNNHLIIISEETFEYYNYTTLKKAIYSRNILQQCNVCSIVVDNPSDGYSAVTDLNHNTTHIRSLNDFLLLTSNAIYLGEKILRGYIHVHQWISSISNFSDIIWSFAKSNYLMPWNSNNYTIPIQRIIKRKDDGTILEILNIFNYKTRIIKTDLIPPKGIFCNDSIPIDQLISLQDIGIKFPDQFSVHIDVSTTYQQLWHSIHLRYYLTHERKLIRYDYTPFDNTQNPITIILDYSTNASRSYKINRRTGSCTINELTEINSLTSILHNPIETLIKYEHILLSNPPQRFFQYTGNRPCRGSILCTIFIGQMSQFPLDSDENWLATNIEWAWSKRNIDDDDNNNNNTPYDYPVYLNLNLYRNMNEPPANVHYEFYDYRTDVYLNEFDVNLCYRSNQLLYLHLAFQLKIRNQSTANDIENILINRRRLTEDIRSQMMNITSIKYLRISQLELDHHPNEPGHNDTLYCIFTLLDQTPFVDPNSEIQLLDAKSKLENSINNGEFYFNTDDSLSIEAVRDSLEDVQYFYVFNPNININQIDYFFNTTIHVNRTIVETIEEIHEKIQYSDGAQAGAVVGGMFVGILIGTITVFVVIRMIKRQTNRSPSGGLTFRNISFRVGNKRKQEEPGIIHMEHPLDGTEQTFS
ncbi:unnamed protein product [Rotaria sordida]|uniref:DUF7959 domain-containing protein n=1 Tax=Rotaria sordida TaxID=392033 RepID=A0A813YDJ4_9BILA|nr:unnamed protein product [Rotaria sordida]CAF0901612.1 unnamed protein product [Rotaria sordida]